MFVSRKRYDRERQRCFLIGRADGLRMAVVGIEAVLQMGVLNKDQCDVLEMVCARYIAAATDEESRAPDGESTVVYNASVSGERQ